MKSRLGFNVNIWAVVAGLNLVGCATAYRESVVAQNESSTTRIFLAEYAQGWEALLDAIKSVPLDSVNREAGVVLTKWVENTDEKNLIEASGTGLPWIKARVRYRLIASKGFFEGKPSVRVTVQKEQQVQRDVLEGWRPQEPDGIAETTLLYRIGRLLDYKRRLSAVP